MKKILMLALTATMMLVACKKDKGGDEPWEEQPFGGCGYVPRELDEQGRVVQIRDTANWSSVIKYTYNSNSIQKTTYFRGGSSQHDSYRLDNEGRIIEKLDGHTQWQWNYKYNSEGYLIEIKVSSSNMPENITWSDGNIVKTGSNYTYSYGDDDTTDDILDKGVLQYIYSDISGYSNSDVFAFPLAKYFGKKPKKLPIKVVAEWENPFIPKDIVTYEYTKDPQGKILSYIEIRNNGTPLTHQLYCPNE